MNSSGIIYSYDWDHQNPHDTAEVIARTPVSTLQQRATPHPAAVTAHASTPHAGTNVSLLGLGITALALGGLTGPLTPRILLEARYAMLQTQRAFPGIQRTLTAYGSHVQSELTRLILRTQPVPDQQTATAKPIIPAIFDPLKTPDGASIDPVNREFSLVIPKIGVNAAVIPAVNPTKPGEYLPALQKGIAHSSLSYFPNEDGTVYLFSHSTNYDWFVKDLNAAFYLLKNLEPDDRVVLFYNGSAYTYKITDKQVVNPTDVSYLVPQKGARRLILQTCWPPGSTTERLLIFADLVEEQNQQI